MALFWRQAKWLRNHHDTYELIGRLKGIFRQLNQLGLDYSDAFFNGDSAFDTKAARNPYGTEE